MTLPSTELIFALDIGTRSVVGLILEKREQGYHVLEVLSVEHKERAMLDGQIHNVLAVSSTISIVKEQLEKKFGELSTVCVAAAGRSLKTKRAKVEINIQGKPIFDRQALLHMELSAVQKAQFDLANDESGSHQKVTDYCVGYSVVNYMLDKEQIGSLIDQRGETASVEVIATFLPKVVVESLISALQRSNLELEALTLEPIAAINVLIPKSMRRLNVALVDIGAGTSDIAITDSGTVTAYGMVPYAGDEITEALSDYFMLDFPEAEIIKRQLSTKDDVVITDILGMEATYKTEEIITPITAATNQLADHISQEISKLNGGPPKAVMLVGGGSLTPNLPAKVAERLELPVNRVAIRGIDAIKDLTFEQEYEPTPELVTPIGIAIAAKESPVEYISIHINDQTVRLFDIKKLTVGDGLLSSGLELSKLYGKPGMAMMIEVNGKVMTIPGKHGTHPILKKNGVLTELDAPLTHGDIIEVTKGDSGESAQAIIRDVLDHLPMLSFYYHGTNQTLPPIITQNGLEANLDDALYDRDVIKCRPPKTVNEVLDKLIPQEKPFTTKKVSIYLNDEEIFLHEKKTNILLNQAEAELSSLIRNGDALEVKQGIHKEITLQTVLESYYHSSIREIYVSFNNEPVQLQKDLFECYRGDEKLSLASQIREGDQIKVIKKENLSFIFQDVFSKVNITQPNDRHKRPVILRNKQPTSFSTEIHHGDVLKLQWLNR